MREVNNGWIYRYMHTTGASIFFICLYLHIYINFNSDADDYVWYSGVLLYIIAIITAFVGYALPWGQISYWGTIVLTNAIGSIPYLGSYIVQLIWGGFSIANPTLIRFFAIHVSLPFIMFGLIIIHISLLHIDDSSSIDDDEYTGFLQYYIARDLFIFSCFITLFFYLALKTPYHFINPNNNIPASIIQTPKKLIPEWYFWPFYAVLRSVPNKFAGLLLIILIFIDIFLLENLNDDDDSAIFWELVNDSSYYSHPPGTFSIANEMDIGVFLVLGYVGRCGVEEPYPDIAVTLTLINFFGKCQLTFEVDEFE